MLAAEGVDTYGTLNFIEMSFLYCLFLFFIDSLGEALKIVGGVEPEQPKIQEDQSTYKEIPVFNDSSQGLLLVTKRTVCYVLQISQIVANDNYPELGQIT